VRVGGAGAASYGISWNRRGVAPRNATFLSVWISSIRVISGELFGVLFSTGAYGHEALAATGKISAAAARLGFLTLSACTCRTEFCCSRSSRPGSIPKLRSRHSS